MTQMEKFGAYNHETADLAATKTDDHVVDSVVNFHIRVANIYY